LVEYSRGRSSFRSILLGTVPATTKENTSSVPLYTPTVWGDENKPARTPTWLPQSGQYMSPQGDAYQIPQDWKRHARAPHENRLLPDTGSVILPETSPLSLHQWSDIVENVWQDRACAWPAAEACCATPSEAGWEIWSGAEQHNWEWNVHPDESYYACWNEGPVPRHATGPLLSTTRGWLRLGESIRLGSSADRISDIALHASC